MKTMDEYSEQLPINLKVVRFELDFSTLVPESPKPKKKPKKILIPPTSRFVRKRQLIPNPPPLKNSTQQKKGVNELVEELLDELYADQREWSTGSVIGCSHGSTAMSFVSSQSNCGEQTDAIERSYLESLDADELLAQAEVWEARLHAVGQRLARSVRARDRLRRQQKRLCAAVTVLLRQITGESGARFGVTPGDGPGGGEGGYAEWLHAMRLVARLPAGVPTHFRRKLWLTLADRHLTSQGIDWPLAERACFRGTALPDDTELGAQILKDLHRTGCSLFCGAEGRENQAMLRRVLLAYARWNKDVGYCQGFNMIAAIILEVMDKSESDSLKVMIYLVEAVLPDGYFADDLRGLSADMAAFRDLLRLRLPKLADHMDNLQRISDGGGVEPPLPDVFTMQWFLTLYATWLPRESLLRIWDLVLLDGNEILLLTALAIWDLLQDRILSARSADEFYSCMGGGAGRIYEAGDALVARVVAFGSVPELPRLRNSHRYRVTPPAAPPTAPPIHQPPLHTAMQTMTKKGLRLFYSEDEGDSSDEGNKMALATVIPRREDLSGTGDRLSLDIGALKRQYARLRERQRQAHVILAAACARHAAVGVPTSPTSLTVNNLLLGKTAIVSARGRRLGPPPGAIPPSRHTSGSGEKGEKTMRTRTSDTICWKDERSRKYLNRRNSVKWKDIKKDKEEKNRKASIDLDESGDGIIVSEHEANEMIASLRSRSSSETSSYSSHKSSSSDTSLCDDNERASDSDPELPDDENNEKLKDYEKITLKYEDPDMNTYGVLEETKIINSPIQKSYIDETVDDFHSTVLKESSITRMTPPLSPNVPKVIKEVEDISDYLHSAAGEPLRTYIDGFETKLKDSNIVSDSTKSFNMESPKEEIKPYKILSPYISKTNSKNEIIHSLNKPNYNMNHKSNEFIVSSNVIKAKQFTDLSPIDLTPCEFGFHSKSPLDQEFLSSLKRPYKADLITRPPDIIDSLARYPNFVPDIDLSDKKSDIDSPPTSPGAESVIVSEDEPPIPLNIDKYFEHSPEFFGARLTDPNNIDIPNRRSAKRNIRHPKKPDSLNLQTSQNKKSFEEEAERALSLPHSHSFTKISPCKDESPQTADRLVKKENQSISDDINYHVASENIVKEEITTEPNEIISPKDYILQSGRKNSERALQIIQENSKILSRILTKQNILRENSSDKLPVDSLRKVGGMKSPPIENPTKSKSIDSPLLKESNSDSLIGLYKKRSNTNESNYNNDVRIRPISIDDPFSLDIRNKSPDRKCITLNKTPSVESLPNKTDLYGWENKGFLAKNMSYLSGNNDFKQSSQTNIVSNNIVSSGLKRQHAIPSEWRHSYSGDSKMSVTLPSLEIKDPTPYDRKYSYNSDDYNFPLSKKYNDYVLSKASDICSKTVDQGPKICEQASKTDNSQVSDFAHVVTSSISFTYEPSGEDDSPFGAKSNSSDTLCQIVSLDQVSTPISPKCFPKDTPSLPKDFLDKSDRAKLDSDDTCSTITSLIETDTLSSLSYPRSPSTGSYHPFPTRPAMRMPKELGIRLGMYPKDVSSSK